MIYNNFSYVYSSSLEINNKNLTYFALNSCFVKKTSKINNLKINLFFIPISKFSFNLASH